MGSRGYHVQVSLLLVWGKSHYWNAIPARPDESQPLEPVALRKVGSSQATAEEHFSEGDLGPLHQNYCGCWVERSLDCRAPWETYRTRTWGCQGILADPNA